MPKRHDIRRLAMQLLYQLDLRGEEDWPAIVESLADGPDDAMVCQAGQDLAHAAWQQRAAADALASELAPDWPTHRQPPVDRALLRLAYHEMHSGHAPVKVAINEAINLARQYGTEQSPSFINGVLDKMARRLSADSAPPETPSADAWLRDAEEQ